MTTPWSIPWLTWVAHFLFAGLFTLLGSTVMDPWLAAGFMAWAYLFREIDQFVRKKWNGLAINWTDAGLDILTAFVGAALVAWWRS